jgi:hypothetical protein
MEPINKLQMGNVPTLSKVWEHNSEVLGIDENGDLVVVARLASNEGTHSVQQRQERKRPPHPRKKEATNAESTLESLTTPKSS